MISKPRNFFCDPKWLGDRTVLIRALSPVSSVSAFAVHVMISRVAESRTPWKLRQGYLRAALTAEHFESYGLWLQHNSDMSAKRSAFPFRSQPSVLSVEQVLTSSSPLHGNKKLGCHLSLNTMHGTTL